MSENKNTLIIILRPVGRALPKKESSNGRLWPRERGKTTRGRNRRRKSRGNTNRCRRPHRVTAVSGGPTTAGKVSRLWTRCRISTLRVWRSAQQRAFGIPSPTGPDGGRARPTQTRGEDLPYVLFTALNLVAAVQPNPVRVLYTHYHTQR